MAPQDSQNCCGNFPKRKQSAEYFVRLQLRLIPITLHGTLYYILPVLHCLHGDAFDFIIFNNLGSKDHEV